MATHSQAHKQAIDAGLVPYNNSIFCGLWQEQKEAGQAKARDRNNLATFCCRIL